MFGSLLWLAAYTLALMAYKWNCVSFIAIFLARGTAINCFFPCPPARLSAGLKEFLQILWLLPAYRPPTEFWFLSVPLLFHRGSGKNAFALPVTVKRYYNATRDGSASTSIFFCSPFPSYRRGKCSGNQIVGSRKHWSSFEMNTVNYLRRCKY